MTNDINTLNGALQELGEILADNLVAMGVTDAEASDGLTTLANKILDITPTLTGVELTTAISCNTNTPTVAPNIALSISGILTATYDDESNVNVDLNGFLQGATVKVYDSETLLGTTITNNNGQYVFSYTPTVNNQTLNIYVVFEGTDDYDYCQSSSINVTVYIPIINILDNITFEHSNGTTSRDVSYINNESVTMNVQGLEDANTVTIGGEVDFLLGTGDSYRDIILTPDIEYDFTGHDFDIIQLNHTKSGGVLSIGDKNILWDATDNYGLSGLQRDTATNFKIKDGKIYCCDNSTKYVTPSDLKVFASANNIIIRVYNCVNYSLIDTQTTNNQGYASYEYEATGQGEFYIKAQSHENPTISTDAYLISDWYYKNFTGIGNWVAFSGRVNTFTSNTDTVMTQGNGAKGGVHSSNTVFYLPDDDYEVSFAINNANIPISVRIGLHSASYTDHHEKAVIGLEKDSDGTFKFDHSTSSVTTVTKITTGVTSLNEGDIIKFKVIDDDVSMYINNTLYTTVTLDWLHTPIWLYAQSWSTNTGSMSIKDFKVKKI